MIGAIDLGGTKVALGVADDDGRLLASTRFATRPERGPEAVVAEMAEQLMRLAEGQPLGRVGVGSVGPLDLESGTILSPPNFPGWARVPLRKMLTEALGVPVVVDNDANVAALAEYRFGAGQGARSLVYATISTGIGGGLVIEGRLLRGLGGGAGEFGHQTLEPDGPLCGCGNFGCLEALASGTAIARAARETDSARLLELAGDWDSLHAGHVAQAAAEGDPAVARVWRQAIDYLALGLGNVITTIAPDVLVLGGGVSAIGEPLVAALREALAVRVHMVPIERLAIRLSALGGDVGLYGAVALALDAAG
ncbi:MAG TPA: ROK family protein [Oscillatoriaceae cyanobacterium]